MVNGFGKRDALFAGFDWMCEKTVASLRPPFCHFYVYF
jgi:hypothetical protein